jgi:hypothetical protein
VNEKVGRWMKIERGKPPTNYQSFWAHVGVQTNVGPHFTFNPSAIKQMLVPFHLVCVSGSSAPQFFSVRNVAHTLPRMIASVKMWIANPSIWL